jgi:hypothetical protein
MSAEDEVRTLDRRELGMTHGADVSGLDELWSDDFLVTPPDNAPKTKDAVIAMIDAGRLVYREMSREVEHCVARDSVVVTIGREIVVSNDARPRGAHGVSLHTCLQILGQLQA